MKVTADREECYICKGHGHLTCPYCKGSGLALVLAGKFFRGATSFDKDATTCPKCDGYKAIVCPECDGKGILYRGHEYASGSEKPVWPYRG